MDQIIKTDLEPNTPEWYYNEWLKDYQQNPINLQYFENKVIENVLSDEDYAEAYAIIDAGNEENTIFKDIMGHMAFKSKFSDRMEQKLTKIAREASGFDNLVLAEYSIARYSPKFGYVPKLFPHNDSKKSQSIVMDVQLKSNFDWPLVVDDRQYLTKDNTALLFSGTQQTHWRAKQWLEPDHQVDMIFCHFLFDPDIEITEEQRKQTGMRGAFLMEYTEQWVPAIPYDANNPSAFLDYKFNPDDMPQEIKG